MASKAPPIPPDQRVRRDQKTDVEGATLGRRDEVTDLQSSEPGDGDVNLQEQGRHGNRYQNVDTVQDKQQDR